MPDKEDKTYSRRDFLKIAGIAGAAVGAGAGLGGLLAACGGDEETTTTAAAETTTSMAGETTTTAAAETTTSVSAEAEEGRPIKLGFVSPTTGNFAVFAISDGWQIDHFNESLPDGIIGADGKKRMFDIIVKDTQSDSNRAAQVAGDLVTLDNVDMLLASGTPDTCNPVADQGEALGCPVLMSFSPWQALYIQAGQPKEFKWAWGNLLGSELTIQSYTDAFETSGVETNKKVGMLFQNDADYQGWMDPSAAPKVFGEKGYELVVPDPYNVPAEDFTTQINMFKDADCQIICGTNDPPWFSNFTLQALQQGYQPIFISSGKALIMVQAVETYANMGIGMIGECAWHPTWGYKDTISDLDSQGLADDYEAKTGQQWTAAIGTYGKLEWAVDVYKRAADPEDKESVLEAIQTTKGTFQQGPIDFTEPVDPNGRRPITNNYKPNIGAQQWRASTNPNYKIEPIVVSNAAAPGTPVQDTAQPMEYA